MNNNWKNIKKEEFKKIFNSKNNSVIEILKNQTRYRSYGKICIKDWVWSI